MIGKERDLVRDSSDDIGASQYPNTMGDGIREAITEPLAQLTDPSADRRIGGIAALKHGAECRRPGGAACAERLKLGMAEPQAVLDRVGTDSH